MNRTCLRLATLSCVAMLMWPRAATAQPEFEFHPGTHQVFRVGQSYTVGENDSVRNLAVIFGDADIRGRVDGDVLVVFGNVQLASTAVIEGSLVIVGGTASAVAGARADGDVVAVAAGFDAPPTFSPGGQYVVIGPRALGGRLDAIVPWVTRGLLWGRPIVPDLPWVWKVAGVFFFISLVMNLMFDRSVRASAAVLTAKPLTAFAVGLLVLLLTGPISLLLAVSVVGIAVVPFLICALVAGGLIGRAGAARWIGTGVFRQEDPEDRVQSLRSFLLGSAVICVAYMIPILGFFTWGVLGVFGLGAAALAFVSAYRRENPAPIAVAPAAVAPAAPEMPYATQDLPNGQPYAAVAVPSLSAPAVPTDLVSFPKAAFRDRLFAFVLDVVLVAIAQQILDLTNRDSAFFLLLLAYHIGFWTWKSTTVGGIICQLRVVRVDGARLRFVDALVRGLSSIFSLAVVGIGCLWILRDPERQAWHDKIAGTYVVKVPRNWPL
jgi:uncharacterized RDD family membrane protein YckC